MKNEINKKYSKSEKRKSHEMCNKSIRLTPN